MCVCVCALVPLNYWLVCGGEPTAIIVYTIHDTHTHIYIHYIRFKGIRITLVNTYDVDKLFYTAICATSTLQCNNNNNIARVQRKSLCRPTDLYTYICIYIRMLIVLVHLILLLLLLF
jgi:hypothetical protein